MNRSGSVFCKGMKKAIKQWSKDNNVPVYKIRSLGVPAHNIHGDTTSVEMFDQLIKLIPEPWTVPYCELKDAPRCKVKAVEGEDLDDFSNEWRKIPTPHLDAFNGVEGGWC